TRAGYAWVDNFNDTAEPSAFGFNSSTYIAGGSGTDLTHTYNSSNYGFAPSGFQSIWTAGTISPTDAAVSLNMDGTTGNSLGVDIRGCDKLFFNVKGEGAANTNLGVGIDRDSVGGKIHPSTVTLTTSWQSVTKTISEFGLDSTTDITKVEFWFINSNAAKGPPINNTVSQTIYVDDIVFYDSIAPTAPSALADNGTAVADRHVFTSGSHTLTFTAPTAGADETLERVFFAHDGNSGGTSWYIVYDATDTTSAPHSFTWDTSSLAEGTSYQVLIGAMDVAGNQSTLAKSNIILLGTDTTAPTLTHTAVTEAYVNQPVAISISISDNKHAGPATLYYRAKGTTTYTAASFDIGHPYPAAYAGSVTIPAAAMTSAGLEYYIETSDLINTTRFASAAAPQTVTVKTNAQTSVGTTGGSVTLPDGNASDGETFVSIPEGALAQTVVVTIAAKNVAAAPDGTTVGRQYALAAYEFGPSGTTFLKPVTLTLLYSDADQNGFVEDPATGLNTAIAETELRVFVHDGFQWQNLGGTVDAAKNTVTAKTMHFSVFGVFPGAATKDQLRPPQKIITPGASPGVNDQLTFGGGADGAKIEIFDVTGRSIRRLENLTTWDGHDNRGDLAESGVYLYQAEIDGQKFSGTVTVAR
ncbi:MAG TPA: hypothetical protein P5079_05630, partial [Elusimicrobiota bacterium]|nr:hypothetical protein [Elusimicrobiota bacterium]